MAPLRFASFLALLGLFGALAPRVASADPPPRRLYLRFATGVGAQEQSIGMPGHDAGVTVSGVATVGEAALGVTVRPGWAVGLGVYTGALVVSSRALHMGEPMPPAALLNDVKDFNVLGVFCDHHFVPGRGLHLEGALGVATVRGLGFAEARLDPDHVVLGAGLVLGLGYDWRVSDAWALGLRARVALATTSSDDEAGVTWEHHVTASPALLFTATYD